jgi:hypothetical protein
VLKVAGLHVAGLHAEVLAHVEASKQESFRRQPHLLLLACVLVCLLVCLCGCGVVWLRHVNLPQVDIDAAS